jgi:hypothetical protein
MLVRQVALAYQKVVEEVHLLLPCQPDFSNELFCEKSVSFLLALMPPSTSFHQSTFQ